jgi:hypothetical protein
LEIAGRYALVRVGPRRDARPAGFEDAREAIIARLREARAAAAFEAYIEGLHGRYDVRLDPEVAASLSLISPSSS